MTESNKSAIQELLKALEPITEDVTENGEVGGITCVFCGNEWKQSFKGNTLDHEHDCPTVIARKLTEKYKET